MELPNIKHQERNVNIIDHMIRRPTFQTSAREEQGTYQRVLFREKCSFPLTRETDTKLVWNQWTISPISFYLIRVKSLWPLRFGSNWFWRWVSWNCDRGLERWWINGVQKLLRARELKWCLKYNRTKLGCLAAFIPVTRGTQAITEDCRHEKGP